jgi:hypothetical protein
MAKIRVDVGVYLPSNPDGVVVDIDKKSGRPLQSHAKVRGRPHTFIFELNEDRHRSWRRSKLGSSELLLIQIQTLY